MWERTPRALLLAALALTLGAPGVAVADTSLDLDAGVLTFAGDDGSTVLALAPGANAGEVVVRPVPTTIDADCTATATEVTCPAVTSVVAGLGAGSDALQPSATFALPITADGGPGDDLLFAGLGSDDLRGGDGRDTVQYDRATSVGVSLDGVRNDGAPGEADGVEAEVVRTGAGADTLTGSSGDDVLHAGAGDDTITPGGGSDQVLGEAGADTISARDDAPDSIGCGDDVDLATVDRQDGVASDCETVDRPAPPRQPPPPTFDPGPPAFEPRPPVQREPRPPRPVRLRPVQLTGITFKGREVKASAVVPAAGTLAVALTSRDGATTYASATLEAPRATVVALALTLPEAVAARLRTAKRLPVRLDLRFTPAAGDALTSQHDTVLVARPSSRFQRTGRTHRGSFGVERITGTAKGDLLFGGSGNDTLRGLGGGDRLNGGTGNDRLQGGAGDDELDGLDGDDRLVGGPGDDQLVETRFGDDTLDAGPGDDFVVGGRGIDRVDAGPGDDVVYGGSAPDTVDCGPGDDVLFINLASERARSKGCETILEEEDEPSVPCGTDGSDQRETLFGTGGNDRCVANGGDDDLEGAGGDDVLLGGGGDDRLFGRFGADVLDGGAGNDELEGGRGRDTLRGGAGNDQLNGGFDPDRLQGGPGADRLIARSGGKDVVDCGPGRDTAIVDRADTVRGCERVSRA